MAHDCTPCELRTCPVQHPHGCESGRTLARDPCGCCDQCTRMEWEPCGGQDWVLGYCALGLTCASFNRTGAAMLPEIGVCKGVLLVVEISWWVNWCLLDVCDNWEIRLNVGFNVNQLITSLWSSDNCPACRRRSSSLLHHYPHSVKPWFNWAPALFSSSACQSYATGWRDYFLPSEAGVMFHGSFASLKLCSHL
jgi:hypothetical protein